MNVRLAANFIQNTDWNGNWGHLQIVDGATNNEIEVQIFRFFENFVYFRYERIRPVTEDTDGYGNPLFYKEIDLSLGERTAEDFWSTLSAIHETFRAQTPNYLYNLGQNSNSYVNTLLWMVGIDLAPLISGVRPSTVTGMDPIAAGVAATTFSNGNPIEWAQWYQLLTSPFPGSDRNLLTNGYGPGTEIIFQLALTQSPDFLRTGDGDDTIFGLGGHDTLWGREGNDRIGGDAGDDVLYGGEGTDTLDYSATHALSGGSGSEGVELHIAISDGEIVANANDDWGGQDVAWNFEAYLLSGQDDLVQFGAHGVDLFARRVDRVTLIDGGSEATEGDTIDFSGVSERGIRIDLLNEFAAEGPRWRLTMRDFENAVGSEGNDRINGTPDANRLEGSAGADKLWGREGDDTLIGGEGADELLGGLGNDWLIFDAQDTIVRGGGGRDVAWARGTESVTLDLTGQSIEIAIGTSGDDTFLNARRGHMIAGGEGDDYVSMTVRASGAPTVLWGGEGADTFEFLKGDFLMKPIGVLLATVDNLTHENFASFTRDLVDTVAGFRWGQIDAIILNSDPTDRMIIDGEVQGVSMSRLDWRMGNTMGGDELIFSNLFLSASAQPGQSNLIADHYDVGFLGRTTQEVFAGGATPHMVSFDRWIDDEIEAAHVQQFGPRWWDGIFSPERATAGEPQLGLDNWWFRNYYTNFDHVLAWTRGYGAPPAGGEIEGNLLGAKISDLGRFTSPEAIGPWFVVGGAFDGTSLVADGSLSAIIPEPDWL